MKLGAIPSKPDTRDLKFSKYRIRTDLEVALPKLPMEFGHDDLVTQPWGALGNDFRGDCVIAGAAHEIMIQNACRGVQVPFSTAGILADYGAITGFDPVTGNNDNGTDVRLAMQYRQETGIVDANGGRHKIQGYIAVDYTNFRHVIEAIYLFGCIGYTFAFPDSAWMQYQNNQIFEVVPGDPPIDGYHYVPLTALRRTADYRDELFTFVSWGRVYQMTKKFMLAYGVECWVTLTNEMLVGPRQGPKSLEGFNYQALLNDLNAL